MASDVKATDLEIRSINGFPPLTEMANFVAALIQGLKSNTNYEIYQALYSMFLKNHGDVVYNYDDAGLMEALEHFNAANGEKGPELDQLSKYCSGVIDVLLTM
jgi:U3 small nucleolar RNA-associated protein 21